jgi:hypothetical protein
MRKKLISIFMLSCALYLPAQGQLLSGTSIVLDSIHQDADMAYTKPLVDFKNKPLRQYRDAEIKQVGTGFCTINLGHKVQTPFVTFPIDKDVDLNKFVTIALDIKNEGNRRVAIEAQCYADKDTTLTMANGALFYYRGMLVLEPGETDTMLLYLSRPLENRAQVLKDNFDGMYGIPGGFIRRSRNLNLSDISHISIFKQNDGQDTPVTVSNVRALGRYKWNGTQDMVAGFFPFIDAFGQYKHSDWPGKTHSVEDMHKQREAEECELAAHPSPAEWNKYGGWAQGPTLAATGHFRVEKYKGKWWFVDPEGKLFWSQGLNIVTVSQHTRIKGRENYFSEVPNDFYRNNLKIKYQEEKDLFRKTTEQVYRRLRSWGINTIAANSNTHFYREARAPYTIEIRSGLPHRLPDDFDAEAFKASFRKVLTDKYHIEKSANDPWCIGYFIDNEYAWPKRNQEKAIHDYFRAVREVLNELAPKKLYLGCRSNSVNFNRIAFEAAAKYCDVISINHYDYNVSTFKETEGLDRPLIIGEFHFGALDRGLPHTGLRAASNQRQRARLFEHFVSQALESDCVVGAHWFQYLDQPYTARSDGENYQIGFVDICDRPYPEMIEAARKISDTMYSYRLNGIQY